MSEQTETYIQLKPIAERFNRISKEITDDEIHNLIKDEMRKQIIKSINFESIQDLIDQYFSINEDEINDMISESLKRKFNS